MPEPVDRLAARVLLLDREGRVLLFRGCDPATPDVLFWFTPGGGRDDGESPTECAARELHEETGLLLDAAAFGEPVHKRVTLFPFNGSTYRSAEDYFLVRVDGHDVRPRRLEALEHASILGHRWWHPEELRAAEEPFYPEELLDLLDRVAAVPR